MSDIIGLTIGIEYLRNNRVDLIVLDMIMDPGMDRLDTYRGIVSHWVDQKVIITSGYSETEHSREVLNLGTSIYLKKPYTIEKCGTAVYSILNCGGFRPLSM